LRERILLITPRVSTRHRVFFLTFQDFD